MSGTMLFCASTRSTPIWAKPRAAPPPSAIPMRGTGGAFGSRVASAARSPSPLTALRIRSCSAILVPVSRSARALRTDHAELALDDGIIVVAAACDRLHGGGVEQAV